MQDLRTSQQWCWRCKYSKMLAQADINVSMDCSNRWRDYDHSKLTFWPWTIICTTAVLIWLLQLLGAPKNSSVQWSNFCNWRCTRGTNPSKNFRKIHMQPCWRFHSFQALRIQGNETTFTTAKPLKQYILIFHTIFILNLRLALKFVHLCINKTVKTLLGLFYIVQTKKVVQFSIFPDTGMSHLIVSQCM